MGDPVLKDKLAEPQVIVPEERFGRRDVPSVPGPQNLMQALAQAATNPAMDVEKVERLYNMYAQEQARLAEIEFNSAMAKTQAEISPIAAKAYNDQTQSTYAKLEAIDRAITPIHTKNGLSVSYDTETKNEADPIPQGYLRIVAWVRHSGGHKERHHIDLPPDAVGARGNTNKTMVHAIGSTNTYARRYLKLMAFNVSTFDDRDGNQKDKRPGKQVDEKALADQIAVLTESADEGTLNRKFAEYHNAAAELGDRDAVRQLITARDEMRAKLKQRGARR